MSKSYTDASVSKVMMKSAKGDRESNILGQLQHIDLFESVLSPVITGEAVINDGIDLLNNFPIIGEETIEFSFQSVDGFKRKMLLNIYAVEDIKPYPSMTGKSYTLKLVSPEVFQSNKQLLYKKYKKQSSDIIKEIMSDISKKDVKIEKSKGIDEILISQLKPLQAVDFIRRRSVSPEYKSSSYCFFENKDGFNLSTLEGMFKEGKKKIGDKLFFYENNTMEDFRTSNYRNILAFEHLRASNTLDTIAKGGFRNSVTKYDMLTGETETIDFEPQQFEGIDKKNVPANSKSFSSDYSDKIAESFLIPYDSSLPDSDLPEKLGYLQQFVQQIVQNMVRIHVNGDSTITAGDVIECRLPAFHSIQDNKKSDRLQSGNYLVSKIRHMITLTNNPVYTCSMELIKGSNLG